MGLLSQDFPHHSNMAEKAPPSLAAVAVSSLLLGLLAGYFLGQGSSIGIFGNSNPNGAKKSWPNSYDVKVHAESSDEQADDEEEDDEEDGDGKELSDFRDSKEEVKMVLVVRTDLGMGKGVISSCCSSLRTCRLIS